ncbi:hypothetical protein AAY473_010075 [Plecturocebus cupreus]
MENALLMHISRLHTVEERTNKLEDSIIETIQTKHKEEGVGEGDGRGGERGEEEEEKGRGRSGRGGGGEGEEWGKGGGKEEEVERRREEGEGEDREGKRREREAGSHYVAQPGLKLLGSSDLPSLAFQSSGSAGMSHHTWPLGEEPAEGSLHRQHLHTFLGENRISIHPQAVLKLLSSSHPPFSASLRAGMIGMSHCAQF